MKSFLEFAKEREKEEIQRQISHFEQMAKDNEEKANMALMKGDLDGHKLFLAKVNHLKTQGEHLKSMKEEVEQIDELNKDTLQRYKTAANKSISDVSVARHAGKISSKEYQQTADKRSKGINRADADKRLATYADKTPKKLDLTAHGSQIQKQYHEEVELDEATPAWQRKEGKSDSGGLNKKGIMSYRRANPGSKLSMAVTTKPSKLKPGSKAANRRKSFCARMSGMKKRLTSAKTAKDPNSRINKSLRKWNC